MLQSPWLSLLLTTLLISVSAAVPLHQPDHVKIHRMYTTGALKNGGREFTKVYRKYGWKLPEGAASSLAEQIGVTMEQKDSTSAANSGSTNQPAGHHGTASGMVEAHLANANSEYLFPVTIGGQTLNMNIDTGSSDLWLFSTSLSEEERQAHNMYDPAKSQSHTPIPGATFNVGYGDGASTNGEVAADTVVIGGVTVTHQALELPTSLSSNIIEDPSDGIVGLAFQSINSICSQGGSPPAGVANNCPKGTVPFPQPTWFENAMSALALGAFTVNFKPGTTGYINFGAIDHTAAKGEIQYAKIDKSSGMWQFNSAHYKIGNSPVMPAAVTTGIADSGTSLMMLEPKVVQAYYDAVTGMMHDGSGYTFPCTAKLPDFSIALGDYMATITGDLLNYAKVPNSDTMCYGGLQSNNGEGPQIFGGPLFKSQLVVFDYDHLLIGFAPHA